MHMQLDLKSLAELGVTPGHLENILATSPTLERASERLDELRADARRALRRLAIDLHPDRPGNGEVQTERLKRLTAALSQLAELQVVPNVRRPVPPPTRVRVTWVHSPATGTGSTTSYTSTVTGFPW